MIDPWTYWVLLPAGILAGTLNVIAGGGSFLTLPLLIFLGLPATVANGTNRVAILLQSIAAAWSFHRDRIWSWQWARDAAVPAILGAALGTWAALIVGDRAFQKILAFLMVAVTLWTLLGRGVKPPAETVEPRPLILGWGFFLVGIYGGFVQAGVGFLALAVTSLAGLDLVKGNAIKVFCILCFTVLSLSLFAWQGKVAWTVGITLAAGSSLGGILGARLTALKGHQWVRAVVTVTIVVFAIGIWLRS